MREKGQALVEMALLLPFLLILLVGMVELGVALQRQMIVVNAAREGARFGAFGATPQDIHAQTLLAASQMVEFDEENAVITVIHAETDAEGDFETWTQTTYPADAHAPHVTQEKVWMQLQMEGDPASLKLVVVDMRYDHHSMLGLPLVGALADRIPIGSWTVMRMTQLNPGPKGVGCCALPVTLPIEDVERLSIGDYLPDIRIGSGPGQFGWLFWQPDDPGAGSVPVLIENLQDRCNAKDLRDACDGSISLGPDSWVWGDAGEMAGAEIEMKKYVGAYYPIPVWDEFEACNVLQAQGRCPFCKPGTKVAHIVAFALMEIVEVNLDGSPKTISARFRGWYDGCE